MAQMPIQLLAGRAETYSAANPVALTAPPRSAIPRGAYLYDTSGISGGQLRPGAVDQAQFKALLAETQNQSSIAPPITSKSPLMSGIPNLSPAQFAALGAVEEPNGGELVLDIPAPNPLDPGQSGGQSGQAGGVVGGIEGASGAATNPLLAAPTPALPGDAPEPSAPEPSAPAPVTPALEAAPSVAPEPRAPSAAHASAERGPIPGSHRGADGVWELPRLPDKDERDMLRGQKWRVVESEAARKLFLGPDGKFGWDDFVDLINPLQHIPLVNIAYRAITGDEIYGAARMVDAALGPLAGVSTIVDLAFKDITGKSMASNAVAALFGTGEELAGDVAGINTASGGATQLADAGLVRRGSNN